MDRPTHNRREVYRQTKEHYLHAPIQESSVLRRATNIAPQEMATLSYKYPKVVVAPVINDDCVYVALDYVRRGFHPIILNMSSWRNAGGGVENGAGAQEEELFRRSDYFKHLHQKYYPFRGNDVILSKGVEFFRNGRDKGYTRMDTPVKIDCIAAPALRNPPLNASQDDFDDEYNRRKMEVKIRVLLYQAAMNGNDCIILSAWGCGAFHCPPKGVARLFRKVLGEFAGVFRETPFAVLGENYTPFAQEFQ
jgi:uncharacterized protein (TIGR02452 family)